MTKVKETTEYDNFLGKKEEVAKPAALFDIEETEEGEREKLWVGMPEFEQKFSSSPCLWRTPMTELTTRSCV